MAASRNCQWGVVSLSIGNQDSENRLQTTPWGASAHIPIHVRGTWPASNMGPFHR